VIVLHCYHSAAATNWSHSGDVGRVCWNLDKASTYEAIHRINEGSRRVLINRFIKYLSLAISVLFLSLGSSGISLAQENFQSPDVLVLGDSQLSFGAGVAFIEFLKNNGKACGLNPNWSVGVLGVRSSSLRAWTAKDGGGKKAICDVDPKWKVNAGSFGVINKTGNKYVQIGQGDAYQFCDAGKSPFQSMFAGGYYNPKIFIMAFLGNATERWANSGADALDDVKRVMQDVPADLPCIFMTTAPGYTAKINDERQRAQNNIESAFKTAGKRCTFVQGYTPATIAANQGNASKFRLKPDGTVKDPYHPTEDSARQFLSLIKGSLCNAIKTELGG
jgi:hypothetical protein